MRQLSHPFQECLENGTRTDTRRIVLSGEKTRLRTESGENLMGFSVWPGSIQNPDKARHTYGLVEQGFYPLNIDDKQMDLGATDS